MSADGQQLIVRYTVGDPAYLTEPFSGEVTWTRLAAGTPVYEFECDEEFANRSTKNAFPERP